MISIHNCNRTTPWWIALEIHELDLGEGSLIFVYRMEFDKTRWSCSWNSDQNYSHNSAGGPGVVGVGSQGVGDIRVGGGGAPGVVGPQGVGWVEGSGGSVWYEIDPLCMT